MTGELLAFVALAVVVIVTPGPDTALTIRNTISGGRRAGIGTAVGVSTGLATWTLASAAGVAALLVASEPAFMALKYAGAAYLIYLGLQTLVGAFRPRARAGEVATPKDTRDSAGRTAPGPRQRPGEPQDRRLLHAACCRSSRPRRGRHSGTLLGLGLLFCAMTFAWLCVYATAVDRMSAFLWRTGVRRAIDAVMGTVLVALGGRLALERR